MKDLSRRQFSSLLGVMAIGSLTGVAKALGNTLPPKGVTSAAAAASVATNAEALWADLMAGNKRFVSGRANSREFVQLRQELAKGQHPRVIVLGCADSRTSPELIFDKNLGELFVVRTAGNIADEVALGSLEYAAEHLHASMLVVLGHEKCGAVAAAASGGKMPTPNLGEIVEKISPALKPLQGLGVSGDALAALGVEANVRQSMQDLLKNSPILRHEYEAGKLTLIPAVYRLASGEVTRIG